jgi:hypothetical protein
LSGGTFLRRFVDRSPARVTERRARFLDLNRPTQQTATPEIGRSRELKSRTILGGTSHGRTLHAAVIPAFRGCPRCLFLRFSFFRVRPLLGFLLPVLSHGTHDLTSG